MSLRLQLRDSLECFVFPALAALLPWRAGFALLRLCSRLPLYDERVAPALAGAQAVGLAPDPDAFRRRQRLYLLLEHADLFLSLTRSRRWFARHVRVHGEWPKGTGFSAVFFHYGTGLWSMRQLADEVGAAHFVSGPLDAAADRSRPFRRAYSRLRLREVARAGHAPVIHTGGSARRMADVLRQGGGAVVVGGDVPPGATHGTCPVELLGRSCRLAQGLVQVAQETGTPLIVFSEQLEGRARTLRIDAPIVVDDIAAAMQALAARLEARLRADPAAWHFWPQLEDYRTTAPDEAMPARSQA